MMLTETQQVRHEIATQSRLRDEIPELVPTTLARELANHYPAEVKRQSDRLASLAAELLRRERNAAADERTARRRESRELRDRIERLQSDLAAVSRQREELDRRAAANVLELQKRLDRVVDRVRRFRNKSRASKGSLLADVTQGAEACLEAIASGAEAPRERMT